MNIFKQQKKILFALILFVFASFASFFELFYTADRFVMDKIYQVPSKTHPDIRIVAIDERTLDAYGPLNTWSREKTAELVSLLNEFNDWRPAVIGFDIMFIGETGTPADAALANACTDSMSVVAAANIVNETVLEPDENGKLKENKLHIAMIEKPYSALLEQVNVGFANTSYDEDSYIRRSFAYREYEGERINSLSMEIYRLYCEQKGLTATVPPLDSFSRFSFTYSGKPGGYEAIPLVDILNGNVDPRTFKDCIVLVGAYAPGLQDAFNTSIDRSQQMYGVEIHANIVEALLEGKTVSPANPLLSAIAVGIALVLFYFIAQKVNAILSAIIAIAFIALQLFIGKFCYQKGMELPIITLPIFLLFLYIFQLVKHYLEERNKRKQVVDAFKKYVAPQVVDEISKSGDFQLVLGGENRDIACLFVDIRGFTPMSESLEPEQVVEILNAYLSLTTNSIFQNSGTLDKFIGDATMAVFNAPFDLDDYIYKAVCTARDIAAGSEELEKKLMERFGKSVSFGIGVNCGPAVVGNIGCEFRMDYTAIGDTVNTAARLESNAKRGQILISESVYLALQDRIEVEEVGVIPLKGKSNGIMVYSLTKVL